MRFLVLVLVAGISTNSMVAFARGGVDYSRDIKPLLVAHCYTCHGALQQKSGLRVDTVKSLLEGGSNGPAIVAGRHDESL
jgi:hypothetical protein